jgi:hypothetical protein
MAALVKFDLSGFGGEFFSLEIPKMNDFFNKLFGKHPPEKPPQKPENLVTPQDETEHVAHYKLVQMVLRLLLRKHGIPGHWIELQELTVPGKVRGLAMHVRLVLKYWDPNLMNHIQALQNQFLADIKRYEPKCKDWLYGLSWQLETGSSCPNLTLPDKPFWTVPGRPALPEANAAAPVAADAAAAAPAHVPPAPVDHSKLERLFADRDQEMKKNAESGDGPEFQDTQPLDGQDTQSLDKEAEAPESQKH